MYSISCDLLTNNNQIVSEETLRLALKSLQNLEPIGVGAKDLQNCLLLQLKKRHPSEKDAVKIISEYYVPFSNKNFDRIITNLNISGKRLKLLSNLSDVATFFLVWDLI